MTYPAVLTTASPLPYGDLAAQSAPTGQLVAPYPPSMMTTAFTPVIGTLYGCRVTAPQNGTLHDLSVFISTTSGNLRLGIYDTGQASATNRTLLFDSGSVASAANWKSLGDPGVAVTIGQQLDFVAMADNTTIRFGGIAAPLGVNQYALPTGYLSGGVQAKSQWSFAAGAYAAFPATVSEANAGVAQSVCIIARISY